MRILQIGTGKLLADFQRVDLQETDLRWTDLKEANLRYARLQKADLRYTRLQYADLKKADLQEANLRLVNFRLANLRNTDLRRADLQGAHLQGAHLPSPTMLLLASWDSVSPDLCSDLMNYDAANHPDGQRAFTKWANGGPCPYDNCPVQRAASFREDRASWRPDRPLQSAFQLMLRLFAEKDIKF